MALQDTFTPDPSGRRVLEGIGLVAGSDDSAPLPAVWDYPVKLAQGTFAGNAGHLTVRPTPFANVSPGIDAVKLLFGNPNNGILGWDDPTEFEFAAVVVSDTVRIPEPATLVLFGIVCGMHLLCAACRARDKF
jgi:hypothetical protein